MGHGRLELTEPLFQQFLARHTAGFLLRRFNVLVEDALQILIEDLLIFGWLRIVGRHIFILNGHLVS